MLGRLTAFFVAIVILPSCHVPMPGASTALIVRPVDLVQAYRDDPTAARLAYDGQTVAVPVNALSVTPEAAHWHLADTDNAPAIVFDGPFPTAPKPPCWIEGRCVGRVDDGRRRVLPGYTFHVHVTDARIVPRPTTPAP